MKKFKRIIAAVLAATMVLSLTGCGEEEEAASGGQSVADPADKKDMDDAAVAAAARALKDKLSYPDLKVTKRIKWMAWWDMDETSGEAELFKEAYGIPETGEDPDSEGRIFEYTAVEYGSRFDSLTALVSADNSPDMFPFEIRDFPYGILANRYQPIDDIVDVNSEKWAGTKALMDQFALNGKHYAAFTGISLFNLMWYKKSNIEAIGADDPQELFKQGKWDWDAFLEISRKWQQSGSEGAERYCVDGYSTEDDFIISTGVPMIGTDGTKLVSNLHDPAVERAITGIITTLQKENLRYPRNELNDWQQNPSAWAKDSTLFFCEGTWRYEDTLQKFKKQQKWADDEIKVVPFPKDPSADKYYVQVKVDVPMWVVGSKNKEGVQAWLDICVTTSKDQTLKEASQDKMIRNPAQNWTRELLDFLDPLTSLGDDNPLTPIVEFKTGLGPNVYDGNGDCAVGCLADLPYFTGDSFVQLREENESMILMAIEDINKKIS